jgi:spore coat protein U-like protein
VRFVQVENNGGGGTTDSIAISNNGAAAFDVDDVVAIGSGGSSGSYGMLMTNVQGSFERVKASGIASGLNGTARGFHCFGCTVNLVESSADGRASSEAYGVFVQGGTVNLRNVHATASNAPSNWGLYVLAGNVTLASTEVIATGNPGSNVAMGMNLDQSNASIRNSVLSGSGATNSYGLFTNNPGTAAFNAEVHHSVVSGTSRTVDRAPGFTLRFANSQLAGGPVQSNTADPGTLTCLGVYDEVFASAGSNACPN